MPFAPLPRLCLALVLALALPAFALVGCGDDPKRPLGGTCESDDQCAAGVCIAQTCLDPEGDEDRDGLVNRFEAALGSNPLIADSDGDGSDDGAEVGLDLANPADSDGDGKLDALESMDQDRDADCIADQLDPDDATPEIDPSELARYVCLNVGACGVTGAGVTATCSSGIATCDYRAVPSYEAAELACDAVDNDCDGATDERHAAGGEVVFDGGPYAADAGKALGATCGIGACAGGEVVCAADASSLACSTAENTGPLACDSDMDCDGLADEGEVSNPITDPLAGCSEFFADADNDGHGAGDGRCLCGPFGDYQVSNRDDCAEADPLRYPSATGVCGIDADCDSLREDVGEACDDGNSDVIDGCFECQAVARRLDGRGLYAQSVAVAGLTNGGFVVAWDGGIDPLTEGALGRSLAFIDAGGRTLRRYDGLGLQDGRNPSRAAELVAMPGGGVAVGAWRLDLEIGDWIYEVQRYDAIGDREGKPASVYRSVTPNSEIRLLALGGRDLAWVALEYTANAARLLIKYIDPDSNVRSLEGGRDINGNSGSFDALGFEDGSVVATWSEYELALASEVTFIQRFGADGQPVAEARRFFEVGDLELARTRLVYKDGGWALFFLGRRYDAEVAHYPVGYQGFEGDNALGSPVYLQQDDSEGCPYELAAGFDAAGYAWAVTSDGECRSPTRGWYAGATTVRLNPFDAGLHPDATPYGIVGEPSGPGFVLAFMVDADPASAGIYLMRYGVDATPIYLP